MNDQLEKSPARQAALDECLNVPEARFNKRYPRCHAILGFKEFEEAVRFAKRFNGKIREFQKEHNQCWYVIAKAKGPYVLFNASSKCHIYAGGDVSYRLVVGMGDDSEKDDVDGQLSMRYSVNQFEHEIGVLVRVEQRRKKSLEKKKKTLLHSMDS